MMSLNIPILKANPSHYQLLIQLWEKSVKASHDFLTEADIQQYRLLIHDYYFDQLSIHYIANEAQIIGFIALQNNNIQLLFVDPDYIGSGIGTILIDFAIEKYGARTVDVNEQNTKALTFYRNKGFQITERSDFDAAGKPYPVLSMELAS